MRTLYSSGAIIHALTLTFTDTCSYITVHSYSILTCAAVLRILATEDIGWGTMNDKTKTKHVLLKCTFLRDLFLAL